MEKSEQKKKASLLANLNHRLKNTGDTGPAQAKLRLAIGVLLVAYFCLPWGANEKFSEVIVSLPSVITIFYYSGALSIFLALIVAPRASPARRITGAALEMVSLSIVMYFAGVLFRRQEP